MSSNSANRINQESARFCYLDIDVNHQRAQLATAAAFVHATDTRYGFSSSDLRALGGSELARIPDLIALDHQWSGAASKLQSSLVGDAGLQVRPPAAGNRLVVELFWDVAPLACENFATLCAHGTILPSSSNQERKAPAIPVGESGKPLTYKGSIIHRIVPGFIVQGGDFVFGNGTGGESVFGKKTFKDERAGLQLSHDTRGVLSMGNSGKNSNSSQWFITFAPVPVCNGKHVVFGRLIRGWSVLEAIEERGHPSGEPTAQVVVTDCGVWAPFLAPGSGYWYDAPDPQSFTGQSSIFMVKPHVLVVTPPNGGTIRSKFAKALSATCTVTRCHCHLNPGASDPLKPYPPPPTGEHDDDKSAQPDESTEWDARAMVDQVNELLKQYAVDLVLVAPVCQELVPMISIPDSYLINGEKIEMERIVMVAKPVDAWNTIKQHAWVTQQTPWSVEGMTP